MSPPIRLALLGPPGLTVGDRDARAVLQQPKRLALLGYVLLRGGEVGLRRDELLASFWPELDEDHSRSALRRSLYFLRRELGAEILAERADGRLAVDPALVWCDVPVFRQAMTAGDPRTALELHRGPLLDGVFVSGAPEVERWIDAERIDLSRLAGRAALALVDEPGLSADEMIERSRRAVALVPEDEGAIRRLMTLLDRVGDRAGALRAYDAFAQHLRQELGAEPTGETRTLVERMRSVQDLSGPLVSQPGALRTSPSLPDPSLIAICPFAVQAPERLAYLGPAAMQLLTATLSGAGPLRTVEPAAVLAVMARTGGTREIDESVARRVARHFAAGHYVVGSIIEAGGRLRALATLFARDGSARTRCEAEVQSESLLFELIDAIAVQVFTAMAEPALAGLAQSALRATSSLPALKHYLAGEAAMRAGRPEEGREAFTLATAEDATFALAHYRLAGSFAAGGLIDLARTSSSRALAHRNRLADSERQLVEAHHAWLAGQVEQAEHLYQTIVTAWPESVEAWFHMGDVLFHANPERGRNMDEARFPFDRVIALDPDHVGARIHLARLDALSGRRREAAQQLDQILEREPSTDLAFSLRALRAYLDDSSAERETLVAELPSARGTAMANAFAEIALNARDLDGAVHFGRAALRVARSEEFRALCHLGLAHVLLAGNQEGESASEFEQVAAIRPAWATAARAQLLALPGVETAKDVLESARSEVLALPDEATPFALPLLLRTHEALFQQVRLYLLGLLAVRVGDLGAAAEAAEQMAETPVPEGSAAMVQRFSRTLEAELYRAKGQNAEALERLRRPGPAIWYQLAVVSPFFTGMHERLLHGVLLRESGNERAARNWWATIGRRSPYELAALPAARRLLEGAPA